MDMAAIHGFLSTQAPWARGIPQDVLARALAHSLCFAGTLDGRLVAFARVVTDRATFANLLDVFVLPPFRGRGHATALLNAVFDHPDLQGLRRVTLATADAHGLYARFGFQPLAAPERFMERWQADVYTPAEPAA